MKVIGDVINNKNKNYYELQYIRSYNEQI